MGPNHAGPPLFLENALLMQWVKYLLCKYKDLNVNSQDPRGDRHCSTHLYPSTPIVRGEAEKEKPQKPAYAGYIMVDNKEILTQTR